MVDNPNRRHFACSPSFWLRTEVRVLPLMGGAADKAGNRFERRRTLLALLDVLAGEARSLQVEVPGEEGAGAEFLQVRADGVLVWHQVKRQHARSSWTIRSLVRVAAT